MAALHGGVNKRHDEKPKSVYKVIENALIQSALALGRKVVVDRPNERVVIAGNGMLQAPLPLGWTHLAAVRVAFDGATAAGFAIADNRTAELSEWDKQARDALLREVSTGNNPRLDEMLADLTKKRDHARRGWRR